jgi:hypothetical protein
MEENILISELETTLRELESALVRGGDNLAVDNKVRGRILGLMQAKDIIHECYSRFNNGEFDSSEITE